MDTVKVEETIICRKARRGDGVTTPIRLITEVFTKDGVLIADNDPTYINIDELMEYFKKGVTFTKDVTYAEVLKRFKKY